MKSETEVDRLKVVFEQDYSQYLESNKAITKDREETLNRLDKAEKGFAKKFELVKKKMLELKVNSTGAFLTQDEKYREALKELNENTLKEIEERFKKHVEFIKNKNKTVIQILEENKARLEGLNGGDKDGMSKNLEKIKQFRNIFKKVKNNVRQKKEQFRFPLGEANKFSKSLAKALDNYVGLGDMVSNLIPEGLIKNNKYMASFVKFAQSGKLSMAAIVGYLSYKAGNFIGGKLFGEIEEFESALAEAYKKAEENREAFNKGFNKSLSSATKEKSTDKAIERVNNLLEERKNSLRAIEMAHGSLKKKNEEAWNQASKYRDEERQRLDDLAKRREDSIEQIKRTKEVLFSLNNASREEAALEATRINQMKQKAELKRDERFKELRDAQNNSRDNLFLDDSQVAEKSIKREDLSDSRKKELLANQRINEALEKRKSYFESIIGSNKMIGFYSDEAIKKSREHIEAVRSISEKEGERLDIMLRQSVINSEIKYIDDVKYLKDISKEEKDRLAKLREQLELRSLLLEATSKEEKKAVRLRFNYDKFIEAKKLEVQREERISDLKEKILRNSMLAKATSEEQYKNLQLEFELRDQFKGDDSKGSEKELQQTRQLKQQLALQDKMLQKKKEEEDLVKSIKERSKDQRKETLKDMNKVIDLFRRGKIDKSEAIKEAGSLISGLNNGPNKQPIIANNLKNTPELFDRLFNEANGTSKDSIEKKQEKWLEKIFTTLDRKPQLQAANFNS